MQPELMNCPFCNGPAVNVAGEYISCGAPAFLTCAGRSVRADVEDWNTRATPTPPIEGRDADVERAIAEAIGKADATLGYSFNLTRLVDGEETHTLTMPGFDPIDFEDRDDGYALIAQRRNSVRATAVLAALQALGERP